MARKPPPAPLVEVARRRRGKPAYVPTDKDRRTIDVMIGVGINQQDVCAALGITLPTLRKYYRRELDTAYIKVVARMRAKLLAKADAGDTLCLIHANKVLGWGDRLVVQDGGMADVDPRTLSDAEIEARIARLRRTAAVARSGASADTVH